MCGDYYSLVKQFCEDYGFKVEYREGKYYILERIWIGLAAGFGWGQTGRGPQESYDTEIDAWNEALNQCVMANV